MRRGMQIQATRLGGIERAGAAASKNRGLVAGFVAGAIPVDALGKGESRAAGASSGDQFWRGPRAEPGIVGGVVPRGDDLQDAEAILSIRDEGEGARRDHADFDVVHVVELAVRGE